MGTNEFRFVLLVTSGLFSSIDHQHHHHLRHHLHPSARSRSLLPNHPKHSRGTANMDTEGESAAEGKGNRTGEAARNMSASPPADPVRARPEPGRKDPKEMNTKEGKEPGKKGEEQGQEGQGGQGQGQWLCTHLDYGTIGQTLLKGAGPGREQTLLVQALRQVERGGEGEQYQDQEEFSN